MLRIGRLAVNLVKGTDSKSRLPIDWLQIQVLARLARERLANLKTLTVLQLYLAQVNHGGRRVDDPAFDQQFRP